MATDNSYAPNDSPASSTAPLLWSVVVVSASAVLGSLTGLGIGVALGSLVPGYYRSILPNGSDPSFDPVAVGIGQGLTQGLVFGGIIGLALVALFYWCRSRLAQSIPDRQTLLLRSYRFWIPVVICVLALIAVPVAFILGALVAEVQQYDRRAEQQKQRIELFFAEHPDKFANLTVEKASNGWAYPYGNVKTQADYDFLVNRFSEMFGDELTERMIYIVHIEGG